MVRRQKLVYFLTIVMTLLGVLVLAWPQTLPPDQVEERAGAEVRIMLSAGSENYSALVPVGASVYDAMGLIASSTAFRFKAKYYSGLGYFIEEINGLKNSDGTYWTLYVNGLYATVGASQDHLQAADRIEWRFEQQ